MLVNRCSCEACGGASLAPFRPCGDGRKLVRCQACGHVFVSEIDAAALAEAYKVDYYQSPDDPRIERWRSRNQEVWRGMVRTILKAKPDVRSLLDVGAGTGGVLREFCGLRPEVQVAAVEASAAAREHVRRLLPAVSFPVDDAGDLDKMELRFDVVVLAQTLEHVLNPAKLCRDVHERLTPGGVALITVPNRFSYETWLRFGADHCFGNRTHLQFFSVSSLTRMLRRGGFSDLWLAHEFGGSDRAGLMRWPQYLARLLGVSTELRLLARRTAA